MSFWCSDVLPHANQLGLWKRRWNLATSSAFEICLCTILEVLYAASDVCQNEWIQTYPGSGRDPWNRARSVKQTNVFAGDKYRYRKVGACEAYVELCIMIILLMEYAKSEMIFPISEM